MIPPATLAHVRHDAVCAIAKAAAAIGGLTYATNEEVDAGNEAACECTLEQIKDAVDSLIEATRIATGAQARLEIAMETRVKGRRTA